MEYILINLFGGGTLDWEDIGKTYYDWEDIIYIMKHYVDEDMSNWEINNFYWAVIYFGLMELDKTVGKFIAENENDKELEEDIEILKTLDIDEDFEIYCNCLSTYCSFNGDEELGRILLKYFREDIENINNDIAFTNIEIEENI